MISGKFAISVHILTLLAKTPDEFLTSEYIAGSINLNPVLVRKEIANLKKHHFVESREGKNGGTRLASPPEKISLEAIFKITFDKISLGVSKNEPNPACPVGKKINKNLDVLYESINDKVRLQLKDISLLEFANKF